MLLRISICFLLLSFSLNAQNIKRKGSLGVGLYNTIPDSVIKRIKLKTLTPTRNSLNYITQEYYTKTFLKPWGEYHSAHCIDGGR